jgi:hypothetical protein
MDAGFKKFLLSAGVSEEEYIRYAPAYKLDFYDRYQSLIQSKKHLLNCCVFFDNLRVSRFTDFIALL